MKELSSTCICDGCERRFLCWTNKKVFSDPLHQTLYETYVAEGYSHTDAIQEVNEDVQNAIYRTEAEKHANTVVKEWQPRGWEIPRKPLSDQSAYKVVLGKNKKLIKEIIKKGDILGKGI